MTTFRKPVCSRILAADDNETNLELLREILEDEYDVILASSGEEALQMAQSHAPDLVLLDIMMPGIDGYETCRRLRQHHITRSAKILMLSAKDLTTDRLHGYSAGADDYLCKPFDHDELLAKVKVHLRMKSVEEASENKSRILDLLKHGLDAPVSAIVDDMENSVGDMKGLSEAGCDLAKSLCAAGNWLQGMLNKCERFSQLNTGSYPFDFEVLDINHLIQFVVDDFRQLARTRNIDLKFRAMEEAAMAEIDRNEFTAAVSALVDNALQFAPIGGRAEVYLDEHNDQWRLLVSDNGCGLMSERIATLFEPFANREAVLRGDGDGLSLAIAQRALRCHGGDIRAIEHIHHGASFELTIPQALIVVD